jgi:hypothetical protein
MNAHAPVLDADTKEHIARADAIAAFEEIPSLDDHGEVARLILAEVSLLTRKYRCIRRHDVPHIAELTGLLDVFWQEVEEVEVQSTRIPHEV